MMSSAVILGFVVSLLAFSGTGLCQSLQVPSREQFLAREETCADILNVSEELRAHIRRHRFPNTTESHQLTYCMAVLLFDYKPDVELDMDLMYAVFGQGEGKEQFVQDGKECFDRNGVYQEGISRFEGMYRMYRCYADRYESFYKN